MSEPTTRHEIETVLRAKYESGDIEAGLFNTGICWVVLDAVDGHLTFQWFDEAVHLDDILA